MSALRSHIRKQPSETQSLIDVLEKDLINEGIPLLVDRHRAAEIAGVSEMTVWRRLQDGTLRGTRPGGPTGPWRIRRADLAKYIASSSNQI